ncbi:hypothetical protein [Burkholderia sola]
MMFRHPPERGIPSEPDVDPSSPGIPARLPDSGVVVNVRGVACVIPLPPRDHARPALWRALADWRDEQSADRHVEPDGRQD